MAASDVVKNEAKGRTCTLEGWEVAGEGFHRTWKATVRCGAFSPPVESTVSKQEEGCIYAILQPLPKELYVDDFELLRGMRGTQLAQGCGDAFVELPAHRATSCHLSSYSGDAQWDAAWPVHARYPAPGCGPTTVKLHRPLAMVDCGHGWHPVPLQGNLRPSTWTVPGCGDSSRNLVVAITLLCNFLAALWITNHCEERPKPAGKPNIGKKTEEWKSSEGSTRTPDTPKTQ
mmetsp:Transcript_3215/g.19941  ORF Transcript_3215/g.19941 Transcript_3215/m.19941 type:complete len:231 (-) Transcript_3215:2353-3045(-)